MTDECCRIENFKSRYASIPAIREVEICSKEFKARYQGYQLVLRDRPTSIFEINPASCGGHKVVRQAHHPEQGRRTDGVSPAESRSITPHSSAFIRVVDLRWEEV